jgi:hypothetical protein
MALVVETRSAVAVVVVLAVVLAVVLVAVVAAVVAALLALALMLVLALVLATPPFAPTADKKTTRPCNPARVRTQAPSSANRRRWLAQALPPCSIERNRDTGSAYQDDGLQSSQSALRRCRAHR